MSRPSAPQSGYNPDAPKRAVNLSLNEDLVQQARRLTNNLSAEVESLLAAYVQERKHLHEAEVERLRRTTEAWNAYAGKHGSFADEFSTL